METLKQQYETIVSNKKEIVEEINILANNEAVKRYLELCSQNKKLEEQQNKLYERIKRAEYSACSHIWVRTLHTHDDWEGRSCSYYGCIKCGLDQSVFGALDRYCGLESLTPEQQIMYDFLNNCSYGGGIHIDKSCDLDLASAIYLKIKEAHPSIDDETARKYLEIALDNMKNKKVNDERKVNRIKRLSLSPKFGK